MAFGGGLLSAGEVVGWSKTFLGEFQAADVCNRADVARPATQVRWNPPAVGVLKLNVDAGVRFSAGLMGIGLVVRDWQGVVLGSSAQICRAALSPLLAEATALLRGLQYLWLMLGGLRCWSNQIV
ncbi:hypothetical protein ACOSQ2_029929 [Xanthoceras sorbifolium]